MSLELDFSDYSASNSNLVGEQNATITNCEIKQSKSGNNFLVIEYQINNTKFTVSQWNGLNPENKTGLAITKENIAKILSNKIKKSLKETEVMIKERGTLRNIETTLLNVELKIVIEKDGDFHKVKKILPFGVIEKIKEKAVEQDDVPF